MPRRTPDRQRQPVSVPMLPTEIDLIDRAAALHPESRASYARRVLLREAKADLQAAKQQKQQQQAVA